MSVGVLVGIYEYVFLRESLEPKPTTLGGLYWYSICLDDVKKAKGLLWYWVYIYYLSKFYELGDTILLVLKKVNI